MGNGLLVLFVLGLCGVMVDGHRDAGLALIALFVVIFCWPNNGEKE